MDICLRQKGIDYEAALMVAAQIGNLEIIMTLVAAGANDFDRAAKQLVEKSGLQHLEILEYLIRCERQKRQRAT